jgi:hypothetical protein
MSVPDEAARQAALKAGWFDSVPEAIAGKANAPAPAAAPVVVFKKTGAKVDRYTAKDQAEADALVAGDGWHLSEAAAIAAAWPARMPSQASLRTFRKSRRKPSRSTPRGWAEGGKGRKARRASGAHRNRAFDRPRRRQVSEPRRTPRSDKANTATLARRAGHFRNTGTLVPILPQLSARHHRDHSRVAPSRGRPRGREMRTRGRNAVAAGIAAP